MLDDFDQKFFVYDLLSEFESIDNVDLIIGDHRARQWDRGETLIKYVNKVHEEVIDCEKLIVSDKPEIKALGEIVKKYDELLQRENCLDFSTIQTEMLNLLNNNPEAVSHLHEKIHYIMVDEYQDTNTIQEMILFRMLNPSRKNICVVGDDDQGLYRFRGATIRNILEFPGNFSEGECGQVTLATNFRSHPGIIDFYNRWMEECNWSDDARTYRYPKTIKPRTDKRFEDYPSVMKVSSRGEAHEWYDEVYQFIQSLKDSSILFDYNQIAFLCKSVKNDKITGLAGYLEERDIQIFSPRSALFFEREEIQLMMGAIIFIFGLTP
jgi:DNA helicase-2/ATP-dependent DNA helicase PcrA